MKTFILMLSLTLLAFSLRIYPTIISSLPFSTDSWPIIGNTKLLIENSPVNLDSPIMDGYNCYWPASSIYASTFSLVTGSNILDGVGFSIPFAGALAVIIFYTLAYRLCGSHRISFYASAIIASSYPYTFFTAGVTKETFASPLLMLILLLFTSKGGLKEYMLFTLASAALVLSHHLTTLVALTVLACTTLAQHISGFRRSEFDWKSILSTAILLSSALVDFIFYAHNGFKITLSASDILSASSYQLLFFTLMAYTVFKPSSNSCSKNFFFMAAVSAVVTFIAMLTTVRPILPDAPILPKYYLIYSTPYIIYSALAVLGLKLKKTFHLMPMFWLSSTLALEAYSAFGSTPLGLALACRTLNFLSIPLAIFSASGLHRLDRVKGNMLAASILLTIVCLNIYTVYSAVSFRERYLGYFWLYSIPEYESAAWLSSYNGTVSSDVKFSYLLEGYFKVKVDVLQALKYLSGKGCSPKVMLLYDQMSENGYVLYGGYSVNLPEGWTRRLEGLERIYSNGQAKIFYGARI
ncbi:MAG: hypothetical protein H5T50_02260 [Nitrososphaeria archaeon]|nr:hypothetical protein [Nitrososphaeria archaeon]